MAELYLSDGSEFSKIPLITETVTTDTNLDNHNKTGYYVVKGVPSTGGNDSSPVSQWVSVFTDSDIGTPFQIAIPDGSNPYLQATINVNALSATSVRIANIIVVKIA